MSDISFGVKPLEMWMHLARGALLLNALRTAQLRQS